jgi:hypothetical protein
MRKLKAAAVAYVHMHHKTVWTPADIESSTTAANTRKSMATMMRNGRAVILVLKLSIILCGVSCNARGRAARAFIGRCATGCVRALVAYTAAGM